MQRNPSLQWNPFAIAASELRFGVVGGFFPDTRNATYTLSECGDLRAETSKFSSVQLGDLPGRVCQGNVACAVGAIDMAKVVAAINNADVAVAAGRRFGYSRLLNDPILHIQIGADRFEVGSDPSVPRTDSEIIPEGVRTLVKVLYELIHHFDAKPGNEQNLTCVDAP